MPSAASSRRSATTISHSPGGRWPSSSSPSFSSSRRSSRCRSSSLGSSRDRPTDMEVPLSSGGRHRPVVDGLVFGGEGGAGALDGFASLIFGGWLPQGASASPACACLGTGVAVGGLPIEGRACRQLRPRRLPHRGGCGVGVSRPRRPPRGSRPARGRRRRRRCCRACRGRAGAGGVGRGGAGRARRSGGCARAGRPGGCAG